MTIRIVFDVDPALKAALIDLAAAFTNSQQKQIDALAARLSASNKRLKDRQAQITGETPKPCLLT